MVKIASWKFPTKESRTSAPTTMTTPMMLKFGDACASARVKITSPTTSITAETYSRNEYRRLRPGTNAPIIITGNTCTRSIINLMMFETHFKNTT